MEKINRRRFLQKCSLATAGMALMGNSVSRAGLKISNKTMDIHFGRKRPNIVFFLIDDMGWRDVGFMGSKYYETPNIDKLAAKGMVFSSAYANAANCAPTRACFLTGQYAPRHGIYTVGDPARGASADRRLIPIANDTTLNTEHVTIAEALKPTGYVSASMGKWHMGNPPTLGPCEQGFDVNIGGHAAGGPYTGNQYFSPYDNNWLPDGPVGEYLTDRLSDEAEQFIETNKDQPFFLYLTHYAVHTPIQAKADLIEKYQDKPADGGQNNPTYAAMIDSVDQGIGSIMKKLDDLKLTDNTIVIFFADNGGHAEITSMKPMRGSKGMLYEGGIREPLIVIWPNVVKPGTTCDVPVISTDFFPTMLDFASTKKPAGKILDGLTLVPLLKGATSLNREAIYWHFPAYLEAYGAGMADARDVKFRTRPVSIIRKDKWKLMQFFEEWSLDGGWSTIDTNNAIELYDLENDPYETTNIATTNTTKRNELLNQLIAWQQSVDAPIPTVANPGYGG